MNETLRHQFVVDNQSLVVARTYLRSQPVIIIDTLRKFTTPHLCPIFVLPSSSSSSFSFLLVSPCPASLLLFLLLLALSLPPPLLSFLPLSPCLPQPSAQPPNTKLYLGLGVGLGLLLIVVVTFSVLMIVATYYYRR